MIMSVLKWIGILAGSLSVVAALVALFGLVWLSRHQPSSHEVKIGVSGERLQPCPETPNCVSTQADPTDQVHYIEPIEIENAGRALEQVERWIDRSAGAEVVTRRENYIHAVFATRVFDFKDDFEFFVPASGDVAHVRSAARVGQGDMGVNRARYEAAKGVLDGDE